MTKLHAPSRPLADFPPALADYFDRSTIALALSEVDEDVPLRLVNRAFLKLTGYEADDVLGQNCRFLQGPDTSTQNKQSLHDFVHDDTIDNDRFQVLNYRKDGTSFWNLVFMSRLRDGAGRTHYILASQFDMSPIFDRARMEQNDTTLARNLSDIDKIAKEYGLAMIGSAQLIADSITMMARMSVMEKK
ncbi:PAS domain-containing protein [Rhodobacteraceae bacterium]|nr:PAS domain-containing protein [Paracoccaceae bacterium]